MAIYVAGNGFLILASFQYYAQVAYGNIKLHFLSNVLFLIFFIPTLIYCTVQYGMLGAAWAWLLSNLLVFFIWIPMVHGRFFPGLHRQWLCFDVLLPALMPLAFGLVLANSLSWPASREWTFCILVVVACALFSLSLLSTREGRKNIRMAYYFLQDKVRRSSYGKL